MFDSLQCFPCVPCVSTSPVCLLWDRRELYIKHGQLAKIYGCYQTVLVMSFGEFRERICGAELTFAEL